MHPTTGNHIRIMQCCKLIHYFFGSGGRCFFCFYRAQSTFLHTSKDIILDIGSHPFPKYLLGGICGWITLYRIKGISCHLEFVDRKTIYCIFLPLKLSRHLLQIRFPIVIAHLHELLLVERMEARNLMLAPFYRYLLLGLLATCRSCFCSFSGSPGLFGSFRLLRKRRSLFPLPGRLDHLLRLMRALGNPRRRSRPFRHSSRALRDLA